MTTVRVHDSWNAAQSLFQERRMLAFTGSARRLFGEVSYTREDVLVFGKESAGLPNTILEQFPSECQLRIPMVSGSRSLNLSNSAAIAVYEGWRQLGYPHGQ
jgi:tRNA (cytidine/uridine-2'-O-)-methyltransferase